MTKICGLSFLLILSTIGIGCANSDVPASKKQDSNKVLLSDSNFQNHYEGAKRFWEMRELAKKYYASGKFQESLEVMEDAYEHVAYGRSEKTIALHQMAVTYKAMNDYELAANFYDGAAKMTMNELQAAKFRKEAADLRQKIPVKPDQVQITQKGTD